MKYCVIINNKRYEVEVEKGKGTIVNTDDIKLPIEENKNLANVQVAVTTMMCKDIQGTEKKVIKAPMAGRIIAIKVDDGVVVKAGDTLLILEAMKMENEITAHVEGIVAEIKVNEKDSVSSGDVLMILK